MQISIKNLINIIKNKFRLYELRHKKVSIPFDGHKPTLIHAPKLEMLSDSELVLLNKLLPWSAYTVDRLGRRLGNSIRYSKRNTPQAIPDTRIKFLHEKINLNDKHILELGCYEGIHTTGLCSYSAKVTGVDSRIEHIVKTLVRTHLYGYKPDLICCNLEDISQSNSCLPEADVLHHVGVLYHLSNPVNHLKMITTKAKKFILLDTHYSTENMVNSSEIIDGITYEFWTLKEAGRAEPFAGMTDHAKWLLLSDIIEILEDSGFVNIEILEKREERNGPRVLLFATRQ